MAFGTIHSKGVQEQIPILHPYTWGEAATYNTGQETTANTRVPTIVGTHPFYKSITCSYTGTALIKSDGTLWIVGSNAKYATGRNTAAGNTTTWTQVGTDKDWKFIEGGSQYYLALKHNGTLWAWGENGNGQCGQNSTTDIQVPTQVGTDTDWWKISAGHLSAFAIKFNGTLWAWGRGNTIYETGLNTTSDTKVPTQVGTDTDWVEVHASIYQGQALKRNGSLYSWATNGNYECGNNVTTQYTVPTQTGTGTTWQKIGCPWQGGAAIKSDGTLWTWGTQTGGYINGRGGSTSQVPAQLGSDVDWKILGGGYACEYAIKNGTLVGWGGNSTIYQLGLNNTTASYNTPQTIDSRTNWKYVSSTQGRHGGAFRFVPSTNPIWRNLQSYYSFATTGTTIQDLISNRNLTASNVTWSASGKRGNCPKMNGTTSSLLTVAPDLYHNAEVATGSVSMWIKAPMNNTNDCLFFSAEGWIALGAANTTGYPIGQSDGGTFDTFGTANIMDNNWHHLVYTWNATTGLLYVDGAAPVSKTQANAPTPDSSANRTSGIGCNWNGSYYFVDGYIDEVAFWSNRILTASDVAELYNSGNGLFY